MCDPDGGRFENIDVTGLGVQEGKILGYQEEQKNVEGICMACDVSQNRREAKAVDCKGEVSDKAERGKIIWMFDVFYGFLTNFGQSRWIIDILQSTSVE